jgi:hypothetical protein
MTTELATIPQSDAAALMQTITRAATDPNVDVGKMQSLWDLYEKMDARRAERDFNAALKEAQGEIPAIFKNKKADKNKYADLEQVNDVIVPIITRLGFAMSFGNEDGPLPNHYRVVCFLSHDGGHTRKYHADIPADNSGSKNGTQGFGSTISYGRRYLTLMIFNVSTTDDNDGAGGGGDRITPEQIATLKKMLPVAADLDGFMVFMKIKELAELPAAKFAGAVQSIEKRNAAKAAKAAAEQAP